MTRVRLGDDVASSPIELPFNFRFFHNIFESIRLHSNGVIGFIGTHNTAGGSVGYNGRDLSNAVDSEFDILAFLWTDLNPGVSGEIYIGNVGDDTFGIIFDDVPKYGNFSCTTNIEVLLHRDGDIEVIYNDNKVGAIDSCIGDKIISIGIKGPYVDGETVEHYQIFGPSYGNILRRGSIKYSLQEGGNDTSEPSQSRITIVFEAEFGLIMRANEFQSNSNMQLSVKYAFAKSLGRNVSVDNVTIESVTEISSSEAALVKVASFETIVSCSANLEMAVGVSTPEIDAIHEDMTSALLTAASDGRFVSLISAKLAEIDPTDLTEVELSATPPTVKPVVITGVSLSPTASPVMFGDGDDDGGGISAGTIAGIAIGASCCCCLAAYFAMYFLISRKKSVSPVHTQEYHISPSRSVHPHPQNEPIYQHGGDMQLSTLQSPQLHLQHPVESVPHGNVVMSETDSKVQYSQFNENNIYQSAQPSVQYPIHNSLQPVSHHPGMVACMPQMVQQQSPVPNHYPASQPQQQQQQQQQQLFPTQHSDNPSLHQT
jgi:hypothetical protein